ncbi:hypothetical protein CRG98_013243 [Punica granatum]|uniref:Acyl carrier protein n=1 Tax=Punica granatum TaxID=22663 RepID=A0A2I0KD32_PUNGR|nr:hypothetical protein CRG98_013243 [Punica granatum]
MNAIRNAISRHVNLRASVSRCIIAENLHGLNRLNQMLCTSTAHSPDQIMDRVVGLVSERANFQKDLSLDSLDKVELVMAFEQEFSIEIPEEEADKLTCCADVARYIASASGGKDTADKSL